MTSLPIPVAIPGAWGSLGMISELVVVSPEAWPASATSNIGAIKASLHGGLAGEREAADDGHVAGPKDCGFGKPHALTVALESARDADALGVFAAEALGRGR
jgi:hypothetical protein